MSRLVTHGKTDSQIAGNHGKRLSALERATALQTTQSRFWAGGGAGLRDALAVLAGGAPLLLKAQNFELTDAATGDIVNAQTGPSMTSGRREYLAVFWPGGPMSGIAFVQTQSGAYTDSSGVSGVQLLAKNSSGDPLTSATTVIVPVAGSSVQSSSMWKATNGLVTRNFGPNLSLAAGIYYVEFFYFETAQTTVPQIAGFRSPSTDPVFGGTGNFFVPDGFPMFGVLDSQTTLGTGNITLSTLTAAQNIHWVGLF